uniref:peptidylprolyl isomerase n=1 Tax=Alistipes sp. TaxID=1872444 RepID=UPI004057A57E
MQRILHIVVWMALLTTVGCRELPAYFRGAEPLAKVDGRTLYLHEVERVAPEGISGDDSASFYRLYVDRWVGRQLKLLEAEELFSDSEEDIEALVEEYRQSLLIRKLDQYQVDHHIDTLFTEEEIQGYYNAHLSDFRSDRTWVKGRILRFKEGDRQAKKLQQLMRTNSEESRKDLEQICRKNGFDLHEFDTWCDFEEFLSHLPALRSEDNSALLNSHDLQQMRDNSSRYYFQITSVRAIGEALPLERVRETIRRILFNRRQSDLIRSHEEALRQKAEAEGKIRLYDLAQEEEPTESSEE